LSRAVEQLPYVRGEILRTTADDVAKLRGAWLIVERRHADGTLFNLTGLERALVVDETEIAIMDDDVAPALIGDRLVELGLDHLGGEPVRDDVFVANRLTAAAVAAMQVLVEPGMRVVGVSPTYTHPAVARAVRLAGGEFDDGGDLDAADVVVVTRLAVTYDLLELDELRRAIDAAREGRSDARSWSGRRMPHWSGSPHEPALGRSV